jgi:hypothetical protein
MGYTSVWVDVYDENWELVKSKELGIGDQLKSFTPLIDQSEPGNFLAVSIDDRFQTIKKEPIFLYEHMTPNVDFTQESVKDINLDDADLLFVLYGENYDEEEVVQFTYSTPKDVNLKWGNKPAKAENWFIHDASSLLRFFMPNR